MKIYHNQLASTLNQGFKPVWLVFGDEPWQKDDSLAQLKQFALSQGFEETIRFFADEKFDWQTVVQEYHAMSLFASRRVIEIELATGKVNEAASKVLLSLAEGFHDDVMLVLHGPKIDAANQKKKWFKQYERKGCFLPLYDIEGRQLNQWLQRQAKAHQLNLAPEIYGLFVELFEGNLLALSQELQKLAILFGQQQVSLEDAEKIVIKQAKFNPFQLIDALLLGQLTRCSQILVQLENEGAASGQLIWFLHREISQLFEMLEKLDQGESKQNLYKHYRIWEKRKPLYQHALANITLANARIAQSRLAQLDLLSKTSSDFNVFTLLADVCVSLYHGEKTKHFSLNFDYA